MTTLDLPLRYYWLPTPADVPGDEHNYAHDEKEFSIPTPQAAVVVVDAWDFHYLQSHFTRTSEICRRKIAPVLAAARRTGVAIVHAPGDDVARRFPQWVRYAGETEFSAPTQGEPDWPPREFRRREGRYAALARPDSPAIETTHQQRAERMIDATVAPEPNDFVIATGHQLQRLCRDRRIMYLFYCGFATNMCIPNKPYGMKEFVSRGYHLTLLRDCTTAVEGHDTVDVQRGTAQAIRELEFGGTFTTTSNVFIRACRTAIAQEQAAVAEPVAV